MSNQAVNIAITGNASSLVTAAKTGEKALDGLSKGAKDTGKQIDEMGKEASQAEQEVKDLGRGARTTGSEVDEMGRSAERAARSTANLGRASHGLRTAGKVLALGSEKIVNQYTALAGGAGIGLAMKAQVELNDQITQMGIAARDAQTGMVQGKPFAAWAESTKRTVMDVSKATGQSAEELTSGMQAIIQRTGDMGLATSSLQLMGETATASGSSVAEVGALIANLGQKADIKGPEQMRQAITLLLAQGKSGAFELKDMVTNGERLFSVMSLFGKGGVGGLKSFGAFVQMARTATGSAEQASTAVERLGAFMSNVKKVEKHLASAGIHVKLDERADMETNIKKIISATGGKFSELSLKRLSSSQAFGEEGIRAISMMANEYAAGNGFKMFDSFKDAGGEIAKNAMLQDDFNTRVHDSKLQLQKLQAVFRDFADKNLASPLLALTGGLEWINAHGPETEMALKGIAAALLGLAAITTTVKVAGVVGQFASLIGGGRGRLAGGAGAAGGVGVQHVWVDNMGAVPGGPGAIPGAAAAEAGAVAQAARASLTSRLGALLGSTSIGRSVLGLGRAIGSPIGGIYRSAAQFGSGLAERAEMWAYQKGLSGSLRPMLGSAFSASKRMVAGSGAGALLALPYEYYQNGFSMRSTVAAVGAGVGGELGGALGSRLGPVGRFMGLAGGGMAGRQGSLAAYDWINEYLEKRSQNKRLQDVAAQADRINALRNAQVVPNVDAFAPTFQIFNQIDPQGRTTTRVEGPGVTKFDVLSAPLAPGWGL